MLAVLIMMPLLWRLCATVQRYLRTYMPTNIVLDWLRTRRGLKWAIPAAMLLTPDYLLAAVLVTFLLRDGGPGWLNLVLLCFVWDAFKFALMAPWSLVLLGRCRLYEHRGRA